MSLRDRLDRKRRRTEVFRFEVEDPSSAERELQQVQAALLLAEARHPVDPDEPEAEPHEDVRRLRRQVELATEALDACFEIITFQALESDDLEVLTQESAERRKSSGVKDDDEDEDAEYDTKDPESFIVRLIAASVVVPPDEERMSEKDWVAAINAPEWTAQDRMALTGKALAANSRRNYDVGKGFGTTRRLS